MIIPVRSLIRGSERRGGKNGHFVLRLRMLQFYYGAAVIRKFLRAALRFFWIVPGFLVGNCPGMVVL
ncbi:hypothetical protein ABIE63_000306 [Limibacillus sp. MBR-115]|jgi:hypothetical protein